MTQPNQTPAATSADMPNSAQATPQSTVEPAERSPSTDPVPAGITSDQAEQIIAQLKSLKQNVFILTLVAGFFALRAILFHR